jgi:hypothetical protein
MNEDIEITISKEIAEEIMGEDADFIENARRQANCHDCILKRKNVSMKEVNDYFLNGLGDIVLRGVCDTCGGNNCVSYIASSTDPDKLKIAKKYLENEK